MLNKKATFQRAHGKIDVKINNNEINRFYQSGSAKVFYPKSSQKFKAVSYTHLTLPTMRTV